MIWVGFRTCSFQRIKVPYNPLKDYVLPISARVCSAIIKCEVIGTHPEIEIEMHRPEYMVNPGRQKIVHFHEVACGPPFLVERLGETYTTVAEAARCIEEARDEDVDFGVASRF